MPLRMPDHILCPVDFSDISAQGLRFAAALAKCSGAALTVVFADPFLPPPYFTQSRVEEMKDRFQESMLEAKQALRDFAAKALGSTEIEFGTRVVEALPVDGILRAAADLPAGLIVMGTHGRSGVNRLMLGSVAERVLRESSIPVMTVRPVEGAPEAPGSIRNVVCPVNDTAAARRALGFAVHMAHCLGAALTVLHVREPGGGQSIEDLCAWVPVEHRTACDIREMSREGDAAEQIVAAASESRCDLLVMGARHRRFFDASVLGTTTVRVVRHAPCAVLTVPEKS